MEMKVEIDYSHSSRDNNNDSRKGRGSILSRLGKGKGFKNRQNNSRNDRFNNNRNSRGRNQRETITKEMLDEEMDRYMSNEMDVEITETKDGNNEISSAVRNVISYDDEDEPVKGDINA